MDLAEARRLADLTLRPGWDGTKGLFWVAEYGWEDQWRFAVIVGPQGSLPKMPTHVVTKAGGTVKPASTVANTALAAMYPVGDRSALP